MVWNVMGMSVLKIKKVGKPKTQSCDVMQCNVQNTGESVCGRQSARKRRLGCLVQIFVETLLWEVTREVFSDDGEYRPIHLYLVKPCIFLKCMFFTTHFDFFLPYKTAKSLLLFREYAYWNCVEFLLTFENSCRKLKVFREFYSDFWLLGQL